jgi:hypothetical protein
MQEHNPTNDNSRNDNSGGGSRRLMSSPLLIAISPMLSE